MQVPAMGNHLFIKRVPNSILERNLSWAFVFTKLSENVLN